jgi:IS30 family transposase
MSPCYSQLTLSDRRHLYQLKERKLPVRGALHTVGGLQADA